MSGRRVAPRTGCYHRFRGPIIRGAGSITRFTTVWRWPAVICRSWCRLGTHSICFGLQTAETAFKRRDLFEQSTFTILGNVSRDRSQIEEVLPRINAPPLPYPQVVIQPWNDLPQVDFVFVQVAPAASERARICLRTPLLAFPIPPIVGLQ
jgi:hypothetical protein